MRATGSWTLIVIGFVLFVVAAWINNVWLAMFSAVTAMLGTSIRPRPVNPPSHRWVDRKGWSGIETPDGEDLVLYATCDPENNWHGRVVFDPPELIPVIIEAINRYSSK